MTDSQISHAITSIIEKRKSIPIEQQKIIIVLIGGIPVIIVGFGCANFKPHPLSHVDRELEKLQLRGKLLKN
jgi:hypothetical protein